MAVWNINLTFHTPFKIRLIYWNESLVEISCLLLTKTKRRCPLSHDWTLPNRMTLAWWLQQRAIFDQLIHVHDRQYIRVFLIFDFWQWYSACLNIWWKELMWSQILQCVLWELLWPYISIWHKDRKIIPQGNSIHTLGVSIPSMSSSHWKGKSLEKTSFFWIIIHVS